jgi:glycosyltransferase involved in cell wall biosynthesis
MRILQVMAGKGNGGAELYSTDVMLSLHAQGIDQCVAMRPSAPRLAELTQAGLRMAPLPEGGLQGALRPWQRHVMRRLIAREQPDIIHCWMRRAASLVPASTRPAVIGWFGDYEEVSNFSRCSCFVGCTQDLVRHMRESGIPAARTAYIPTFPSVDDLPALDRATLDTPAQAKLLLTLSRLHPTKGLDTLLLALRELPDCWLWIAGEGPMRAELETLARQSGVIGRVRFLGWRTDRGALLRAADICLLPSSYEPFGTVILDAWSTRTAFIACDSAGPRAHLQNGVNGMLVPAGDVLALGAAIRAVIDDPVLRNRIVENGYADYRAHFTRAAVTRQWISYYQSLADHADSNH